MIEGKKIIIYIYVTEDGIEWELQIVLQGGTIIAYKTVEDLKTVEWYRDT
jgi:hypothetical protein